MLRIADEVTSHAGQDSMPGRSAWRAGALSGAAARFDARYRHLLHGLGDELDRSGEGLKGTAFAYDEADAIAQRRFQDLGSR